MISIKFMPWRIDVFIGDKWYIKLGPGLHSPWGRDTVRGWDFTELDFDELIEKDGYLYGPPDKETHLEYVMFGPFGGYGYAVKGSFS